MQKFDKNLDFGFNQWKIILTKQIKTPGKIIVKKAVRSLRLNLIFTIIAFSFSDLTKDTFSTSY